MVVWARDISREGPAFYLPVSVLVLVLDLIWMHMHLRILPKERRRSGSVEVQGRLHVHVHVHVVSALERCGVHEGVERGGCVEAGAYVHGVLKCGCC
mmetsp:Transcript_19990/g.56668  ORF Transcript_19990/g.56668 Transcript_19990/m.56668 type:complete len:97 (+) Transcript_19990:483-773(+)